MSTFYRFLLLYEYIYYKTQIYPTLQSLPQNPHFKIPARRNLQKDGEGHPHNMLCLTLWNCLKEGLLLPLQVEENCSWIFQKLGNAKLC